MILIVLLAGVLLLCLGALVGSSWTTQALEGRFRTLAAEQRRLNDEWQALGVAQAGGCPRCDRFWPGDGWYDGRVRAGLRRDED